jgi:hypothetical protein
VRTGACFDWRTAPTRKSVLLWSASACDTKGGTIGTSLAWEHSSVRCKAAAASFALARFAGETQQEDHGGIVLQFIRQSATHSNVQFNYAV